MITLVYKNGFSVVIYIYYIIASKEIEYLLTVFF